MLPERARWRKLSVEGSTVTARVGIGTIGRGRYGLAIQLLVHLPSVPDRAAADSLIAVADEICLTPMPLATTSRSN